MVRFFIRVDIKQNFRSNHLPNCFSFFAHISRISKSLQLQDDYQLMTFGVGLCLLTVGVAMMIIVNVLKKCEHDAIIAHLETQVENAKRLRESNRLLGGKTHIPEDKQILVQASNLV